MGKCVGRRIRFSSMARGCKKEQDHVIPGLRIVFFRDLEGNVIELMEGYRDEV
jgi:hypothetical protein